jgi:hypothetical protein
MGLKWKYSNVAVSSGNTDSGNIAVYRLFGIGPNRKNCSPPGKGMLYSRESAHPYLAEVTRELLHCMW